MATFSGSYIQINASTNERVNKIVDNILTPRLLPFRQISVYDERASLQADETTWRLTYANWNPAFSLKVRLNGGLLAPSGYTADTTMGTVTLTSTPATGDNVNVSYNFDYFPIGVLTGYIVMSIDTINSTAFGSPASYTIDDAPTYWDSVIADLATSLAMERLITDQALWHGRLAVALPGIEDGDVMNYLETVKRNSEDRAYKALENEKFKWGNVLSVPTQNYYNAVRGYGRGGAHLGTSGYGKLRGWRSNKYV